MRIDICWTILLEVTTPQKCEKMIDKISQTLEYKLSDTAIEKYWKDETKYKITATSSVDVPNQKDGFYEIMIRLGRLARSWVVSGPVENLWVFSGTTPPGSIRISGINWISFDSSSETDGELSQDSRTTQPIAVGSVS